MSENASAPVAANLDHAATAQKLPNTTATQAVDSAEHHVDPTVLGINATAWVSIAMLFVIAILIWKKVPALVGGMLDKQIAAIRAQLEEASNLRKEAEALKAEAEAQAKAAAADTEALLAHAREEAETIVAEARADAAALIERHGRMAEDKIAAAERTAIAEVRATAASAATRAAAKLIAERHDPAADKALVDNTIGGLGTARLN